jgi:hypothetical protein
LGVVGRERLEEGVGEVRAFKGVDGLLEECEVAVEFALLVQVGAELLPRVV